VTASKLPAPPHAWQRQSRLFLYVNPLETPLDSALERAYLSIISPLEGARNARFATPVLRQRDLQARALVRCALSLHAPLAPEDWVFSRSEHGKPSIAPCHGDLTRWQFNLSDSENVAVVAICQDRAVGVDIELSPVADELLDSPMILSPQERASLQKLPLAERRRRFLDHWTVKEAYLKARGLGIASIPLDTIAPNFEDPGRIRFPELASDQQPDADWLFLQFDTGEYGPVSVCLEETVSPITDLALFMPLRCPPQKLNWRLLHSSDTTDRRFGLC
jgi:4'-phosphopantetheinyl transferase